MIRTANLGYPRIGQKRELKFSLEQYWKNNLPISELTQTAEHIQLVNWQIQKENGMDVIPSNDFSFYDHVLDTVSMLGAIPERFLIPELAEKHDRYFAMARGFHSNQTGNIHALEMTKWFNTNYHHLVPEISSDTTLLLDPEKIINSYTLSKKAGFDTRPVLLGPVSFLLLSKSHHPGFNPLFKLPDFLEIYQQLFETCFRNSIEWLQLDEPFLVCDLNQESKMAYKSLFDFIHHAILRPKLMLTTYFADIQKNMDVISKSSCEGIHIDCTNTSDFFAILPQLPKVESLSLGIIDGRNVWRADLYGIMETIKETVGQKLVPDILLAPSCSLIHVPQDVILEDHIDEDIKPWLSFAKQKLEELNSLKDSINNGYLPNALFNVNKTNLENRKAFQARKISQTSIDGSTENHDDQAYQRHSP
ncbi:5-methyltetrahydropteroyltriglutamate--homocysteine S-methyltransferase, partial [bacterium]